MSNSLLKIDNLQFSYGRKQIFHNFNLIVNDNSIICIYGKNGIGKTTLLNLICGLLKADNGKFYYKDEQLTHNQLKDYTFLITSEPLLYDYLTGYQNITLFLSLWKKNNQANLKKAEKLLNRYSLITSKNELVKNYSLGMRYKLFLIIALCINSNILLMDEPLNAIDENTRKLAIADLKEFIMHKDHIIIFSSHINSLIENLATEKVVLS